MQYKVLNLSKILLTSILFFYGFFNIYKGNEILKNIEIPKKINFDIEKITGNKSIKVDNKIKEQQKILKVDKSNLLTNKNNIKNKNQLSQITISIKKNDTFSKIIDPFFSNKKLKNLIIRELDKEYNLKNLKILKKIYFYQDKKENIKKIILPVNFTTDIVIKISNNSIELIKEKIKVNKETISKKFTIYRSLYEDGIKAKVPNKILAEAIQLYSFDIDFQRDIQKNTEFSISYEVLFNNERNNISYGKINYININIQKTNLEYFLFKTDENFYDYFNKEGKNIKKAILKTPIDGARLSSNFGMRKHPISGFNKLHKGVDFAAPYGTPIYAGGNGIVEYAKTNGGYGKYIRIRHNNNYKTAYGHLKNINKNIYVGKRVNQGDIIGYVGSTGNSTGPHLHYEVIFKNKQINPMKMKLPSGKTLNGGELKRFKKNAKNIYAKYLFSLYE